MNWETNLTATSWQPGDVLPSHNDGCMICGPASASSPLLEQFRVLEAGVVGTRVQFDERHQGAPHYAHGGAVAAVLDDACGYVSYLVSRMFVTVHLEVDYRKPVLLGHPFEARARCERIDGRKVHLLAELVDGGESIAEARGLFIEVDIDHFRP